MCRLTFYRGRGIRLADLVTRPENSLINQSVRSRERSEPLNGDGFGCAWYAHDQSIPARFRSLTPAWSNANLDELARVTSSHCILAHVRAATGGSFDVSQANCHPFRLGAYTLMHNGHIEAFERIRRPLMQLLGDAGFNSIKGTTDSEHLFAMIAEHLPDAAESDETALRKALEKGIGQLLELMAAHAPDARAYLNLVLTDGTHAAACRYSTDPKYADSLYINRGDSYHCEGDQCWMEPSEDVRAGAVLISSEPLNQGPRWQRVTKNQLITIGADLEVEMHSMAEAAH